MMVLIATDLPDPVAPAIRRWGIFARSAMIGFPSRSRPRVTGRVARLISHSGASSSSRSVTMRAVGLEFRLRRLPCPGLVRPDRLGPHGHRHIVREGGDPAGLDPRRRYHFELGNNRPGGSSGDGSVDLEGFERLQQDLAQPIELGLTRVGVLRRGAPAVRRGNSSSSPRRAAERWHPSLVSGLRSLRGGGRIAGSSSRSHPPPRRRSAS
jgi:hypothetical protein